MPNIDLPAGFDEKLRRLRTERHLSEADLAERAGLTYKTIRELEKGRRKRVLERTIHQLAEALGIANTELLGLDRESEATPPRASSGRRPWAALVVLLAVLAASLAYAVHFAREHAVPELERNRLTVRDGIAGLTLWEAWSEDHLMFCVTAPWDGRQLLVGTGSQTSGGGRLLCLERAGGDTLWSVGPDLEALVRAFGAEIVMAANFSCGEVRAVDLEGDGEPAVVARYTHGHYYPTALCVIDRHGERQSQYAHKGHLGEVLVTDLDGDGRDEILASGTNNDRAYQGATVVLLDDEHRHGASLDALCTPPGDGPDSSRVRVVMPAYPTPLMERFETPRLSARVLQAFSSGDGEVLVSVDIKAGSRTTAFVTLDAELNPLGAVPVDQTAVHIRANWPDSLSGANGPADRGWLASWLDGAHRYEVGQPASD